MNSSIFDCDTVDACNKTERQQITYDDDIFEFGSETPADESNLIPRNVSISVTFAQNDGDDDADVDDKRQMIGKRKAHTISELRNRKYFKAAVSKNVPTIKVIANDVCRRAVTTNSTTDEYELLKRIGKGTYGDVYKARWNITQEIIAIKRLTCKLNVPNTVNYFNFLVLNQ